MKLIKPSFEIITQNSNNDGMLKHIELCGRVCYKSEDKIKDDTAAIFVNGLIKSGHTSVLEHGTVYLKLTDDLYEPTGSYARYDMNQYSRVKLDEENSIKLFSSVLTDGNIEFYVTTNYRVLVENNWLDDLQYQCEPTEFHEKRVTVKFICDRGVSHELVRHRVFSFSQESTRYCNYSKDKFGNELTFIIPSWFKTLKEASDEILLQTYSKEQVEKGMNHYYAIDNCENEWIISLLDQEVVYISLIDNGWTPQQARAILPNSLKTELMMTGFVSDWKHFFELRCSKAAHPQSQELAIPLEQQFKKLNLI